MFGVKDLLGIKLASLCLIALAFTKANAQVCDESVVPPAVIDGVTVTATWTGSVGTYPTAWTSCGFTTPINSLHLGAAGAFTYTFNFSEPVNNIIFFITASGIPDAEEFTITTDGGIPTIVDLGSCFTTIVDNTIFSGAGATAEGGGGAFEVDAPASYTSFTISGPGGMAGSLVSVCANSIEVEASEIEFTDATCFGVCDGTAMVIEGDDPPYTFLWDDPLAQTTATAVGLCAGDYTVDVTSASGVVETLDVTISEPDEIVLDVTVSDVTCFGDVDGQINVSATGGTSPYSYDIGGGGSPIGVFTGLGAGDYAVTVIDDNGCAASEDVTIIENPLPVAAFTADVMSGCEPLQVNFLSTGDEGESCQWYFGDGSVATGCGSASHVYEFAGAYDVTLELTDANGCVGSITYNDYINVYPLPMANFNMNPNPVTTNNPLVEFEDLSSGAESWLWVFGEAGTAFESDPKHSFPPYEGSHDVQLIVTSEHGCTDSITKILYVNQEQLIFAPNTVTPDGDLFNEVFKPYMTGIDIYDYHLTIYNRWGEIVFESFDLSKGWNGTYGGEIVQDGVYIWQIVTADIATDKKLEFGGHVTVIK